MKKKTVSCPCYLFYEEIDGKRVVHGKNPVYKTKGAACADVAIPFATTIPPHSAVKIDLWIGFEIPEGYVVRMYPRSSLLIKHGLIQPVTNIDSDFSGNHVHCPLYNPTDKPVELLAGERVAQIECVPTYDCEDWEHEDNVRDPNGFGGSGRV